MEKIEVEASSRTEKPKVLRLTGFIPAVVYGKNHEAISVKVDEKKIISLFYAGSNKNMIIDLNVSGEKGKKETVPVLAQDFQIDPLTDKIIHIDFLRINMKEELKTKVSIQFVGEPEGVKLEGGILVQALRQLEIKCLPGNIPDKIIVDVSALKINESIHVVDIVAPAGVAILTPKEESVALVTSPTKEEEVVAAPVEAGAVIEGAPIEGAAVEGAAGAAPGAAPGTAPAVDAKGKAAPATDAKAKGSAKPTK